MLLQSLQPKIGAYPTSVTTGSPISLTHPASLSLIKKSQYPLKMNQELPSFMPSPITSTGSPGVQVTLWMSVSAPNHPFFMSYFPTTSRASVRISLNDFRLSASPSTTLRTFFPRLSTNASSETTGLPIGSFFSSSPATSESFSTKARIEEEDLRASDISVSEGFTMTEGLPATTEAKKPSWTLIPGIPSAWAISFLDWAIVFPTSLTFKR